LTLPGAANGAETEEEEANNAAVMSILDQLAVYDVPQTTGNMNPERPLIRIAHQHLAIREGSEIDDRNSPFLCVY
jgi:hypothetical protein